MREEKSAALSSPVHRGTASHHAVVLNALRTFLIPVLLSASAGVEAQVASITIEAWSSTAGPYGESWHVTIEGSGEAEVERHRADSARRTRKFRVPTAKLAAIRQVVDAVDFLELPEHVGPELVELHGPQNTLRIRIGATERRVHFHEPATFKGPDADRFRRVWSLVAAECPIRPPL